LSQRPSSIHFTRRALRDASEPPRRPTVALLLDYMSYLDGAYQSLSSSALVVGFCFTATIDWPNTSRSGK